MAKETEGFDSKSCDPTMSRGEFISKVVNRAAAVGALVMAPAIVDEFVAPPACAATTGGPPVTSTTRPISDS